MVPVDYQGEFAADTTSPAPGADAPVPQPSSLEAPKHLQPTTAASSPLVAAAPPGALAPLGPAPRRPSLVSARTRAGIGLLFVAGSGALGGWLAGGYGAGAGVALSAALRNILRAGRLAASGADRTEAIRSGTVAVVGIGAGAWLAYEAWKHTYGDDEQ